MDTDVLIIGGGAAGMFCAVALKKQYPQLGVLLLEEKDRVGKKLLATGNGRCNLGNERAIAASYHSVEGDASVFAAPALERFSPAANWAFWEELGLLLTRDEAGRQYPYTNQASSVLDVLRLQMAARGVEVRTETPVMGLRLRGLFFAETPRGIVRARRVVLAQGGLATPRLSAARESFRWLSRLGLEPTVLFPALTQIKTEPSLPKALKGLRIPCVLTLETSGLPPRRERGEVQFTDYGLSGIPAFQLSRWVSQNTSSARPRSQRLVLDVLPQLREEALRELLGARSCRFSLPLEQFLTGLVNKKLGHQVLKRCGLGPLSRDSRSLDEGDIAAVAQELKGLSLSVRGTTGWEKAQVTAGGLRTADFEPRTLECRFLPGLFAVGEMLDIDGDCGGYNLTWAWSSARLAAASVGASLESAGIGNQKRRKEQDAAN